jgi:hypothetical protein
MSEKSDATTAACTNYFAELCKLDVSKYVEKKGRFSYLSWPFAVQELGKVDPTATWEVKRFNGLPYMETPLGYFVEVAVTCRGVTKSQIHPILDGANKPKPKPTTFDVNTSIQRALVKAIALHGLGLYIYAGEDLPTGEEKPQEEDVAAKIAAGDHKPASGVLESLSAEEQMRVRLIASLVIGAFQTGDLELAYQNYYDKVEELALSADEQVAAWHLLDKKIRGPLKRMHAERTNAVPEQA